LPISVAQDVFLIKYNSAGTPLWANTIRGTNSDDISGIIADYESNVYMTGVYGSISALLSLGNGVTLPLVNGARAHLIKYNTDGVAQWGTMIANVNNSMFGRGVALHSLGRIIYVTGTYRGSLNTNIRDISSSNTVIFSTITTSPTSDSDKMYLIKYSQ
jgi:hypothetical protein